MKRFFLWVVAAALLFVLLFFGLNLFDSPPAPETAVVHQGPGPLAANLQPGNGFFIVWGFAEPPGTEPLDAEYRRRVEALFASRSGRYTARSPYRRWLARLNAAGARHWPGASLYFPQRQGEDVADYFAARRALIAEQQRRFALPLSRFRRLMRCDALDDFTPLNWDCPPRSLQLAMFAAKLHAAAAVLATLDGDWQAAGADLLAAADTGFKLIATGRTLAVNALGKSMVELSLRSLASLLNMPDCPQGFARRILKNMEEAGSGRFGTGAVRAFHWLSFASALARVKKNRIVDPQLLKDYFRDPTAFYAVVGFVGISRLKLFTAVHTLAAFFVQENESVAALRKFWNEVGSLEDTPPWRWDPSSWRQRRSPLEPTGPFWWLRNPLGKMMVRSAVPFIWPILRHYVNRSHELKARHDLTRLLARARLKAGSHGMIAEAELRRILVAGERDPFSGRSYRFSREQGAIYSVGADAADNQGRERPEVWKDSDISVPIQFVIRDLVISD